MSEITVTLGNFKTEVMDAENTVLLDFWAPWCGPCHMMAEVLKQVAADCGERVTIGKVNVDQEPDLTTAFQIEGIPTLMVFRKGKLKGKAMGFQLREAVDRMLAEAEGEERK